MSTPPENPPLRENTDPGKPETDRRIAFFDFDGTLTRKDSFLDFIAYYRGRVSFFWGMLWLMPVLLAYQFKLMPNWRAKERVLTYFFRGTPQSEFQRHCDQYGRERIHEILRSEALPAIDAHRQQGHSIYLVSASPENWLRAWCESERISLIATRLEVVDDLMTGRIAGQNCYGAEKAVRIRQEIDLDSYDYVYAYGDSPGDREMLALADSPHYRPFS